MLDLSRPDRLRREATRSSLRRFLTDAAYAFDAAVYVQLGLSSADVWPLYMPPWGEHRVNNCVRSASFDALAER